MIKNPEATKPDDWEDEAQILDVTDVKPTDWDNEPFELVDEEAEMPIGWLQDQEEYIPDPEAAKPADWDEEEDGEFERPLIQSQRCIEAPGCGPWKKPMKTNPAYKGQWIQKKIPNEKYIGAWEAEEIANPDYFENHHVARMAPIGALALEIWTTTGRLTFDNMWLGNNLSDAEKFGEMTWKKKYEHELAQEIVEKEAAALKHREKVANAGGMLNTAKAFAMDVQDVLKQKPILGVLGGAGLFMISFLFCFLVSKLCFGSSKKKQLDGGQAKKTDTVESDEEKKENVQDSTEKTKTDDGNLRKRTISSTPKSTE